jgi:hypothetical protein
VDGLRINHSLFVELENFKPLSAAVAQSIDAAAPGVAGVHVFAPMQ